MAISGQFAASLQALLQKLQTDQAEVDFQEQIKRRLFANQESQLNVAHPLALKRTNESLADRGMSRSGIGLKQTGDVNTAYTTDLANLRQGNLDDLAGFAKQRLSNQATYNWNFADLEKQSAAAEAAKAATGTLAPPAAPTTPMTNPTIAVKAPPAGIPGATGKVITKKPVIAKKPVITKKQPIIKKPPVIKPALPVKKMPVIKSKGGAY